METQLLIHCDKCERFWDIDNDPECCECNDDAGWQLLVVENEGDSDA